MVENIFRIRILCVKEKKNGKKNSSIKKIKKKRARKIYKARNKAYKK